MSQPLAVLVVSDRSEEAEQWISELRRSGFEPHWQRVNREEPFVAAIEQPQDVVLADLNLSAITTPRLLELTGDRTPGLPVIIVSGTRGEEVAVEMMQRGADDYLLKDRLSRLGPAVKRALHEQRQTRETSGDISARIQAEAAVKDSQRMLETVTNNIPQGVFWKDRNSVYLGCNQVVLRAQGFERLEQIIGKRDADLPGLMPEEAAFYVQKDQEVMDSDTPQLGIIETMTLADGSTIWLETSKLPLHDADGQVVGVLGTWQDITERRRLEEQLRQSQKMDAIGQLAGGVAHDFNNLLTVILGYSELALASLPPATTVAREHVAAIRDAGERASALTRHLLAFSRQQLLEPKVLDLNDVVAGSEKMLRRLIGEHIMLATVLAPHLPHVRVDPGQMEQVILNLAVNARDAMPSGGRLRLATQLDAGGLRPASGDEAPLPSPYVRLSVSDTGCGMPPGVKARIFEPFFTTKPPGRGTGLGLSTVYGIVKQSGGWIEVASEAGLGTTFDIYLPAIEAPPVAAIQPDDWAADPVGLETILLVEDDAAVRVLTRQALERYGYRVLEAAGGREALAAAEAHDAPIDLLITDVVMPELGGRELAETLVARHPRLKVLYVSGYTEDAVLRQGVAQATAAYLQKPFSLVSLAKRAREILDERI